MWRDIPSFTKTKIIDFKILAVGTRNNTHNGRHHWRFIMPKIDMLSMMLAWCVLSLRSVRHTFRLLTPSASLAISPLS